MLGRGYKYLVGIQCMTYNHSQYITDALNGFVMQKTNFPFVILLIDDKSTDGEIDIISNYVTSNFNVNDASEAYNEETAYANFTYARHKTNKNCFIVAMYLKYNHYQTGKKYEKLKYISAWLDNSKYIAFCEGDDYWIDPLKLQKQVEFLDNHLDYSACLSRYVCFNQKTKSIYAICGESRTTTRKMLLKDFQFGTCTVLCRTKILSDYYNDIQPHTKNWLMGDKPLLLYLGTKGKVHTIHKIMATYRILESTASHSKDINLQLKRARNTIDIYHYFAERYFSGDDYLHKTIEGGYLYRAYLLYKDNNKLPLELIEKIGEYKGGYWKLYIVKIMIKVPLLQQIVYKLSSIKNSILTIVRKLDV